MRDVFLLSPAVRYSERLILITNTHSVGTDMPKLGGYPRLAGGIALSQRIAPLECSQRHSTQLLAQWGSDGVVAERLRGRRNALNLFNGRFRAPHKHPSCRGSCDCGSARIVYDTSIVHDAYDCLSGGPRNALALATFVATLNLEF